MSLADNYRILKYVSDGKQVEFPVLWRFFDPGTVLVRTYTKEGLFKEQLSYGKDYSVVATGEDTGRVTLTAPVASGRLVVIYRLEPYVQLLELLNTGKFDLVKLEETLDHIVMLTQQNRDDLLRCLKVPHASSMTPEEFIQDLLSKYLEILEAWQKISIALQNLFSQTIVPFETVDGVLEYGVGEDIILDPDANNLLLSLGGVVQEPDRDYTIVDKNHIRFTENPGTGLRAWGISCLSFSNPDIRAIVQKAIEKIWAEANKIIATDAFVVPGTTEARNLLERFGDFINVKDFGAKGDGRTDDTAAIQAAIDAAGVYSVVYFPYGRYYVSSGINVDKKLSIKGEIFGGRCSQVFCKGYLEYIFKVTAIEFTMESFEVNSAGLDFTNRADIGVKLEPRTVNGKVDVNTDAWFHGVFFRNLTTSIDYVGRGLNVFDCEFGVAKTAIKLSWPDEEDFHDIDSGFQTYDQGYRAQFISNCRFHSCVQAVSNTGANADKLKSIHISNVYSDTGCQIFAGTLIRSTICNVHVQNLIYASSVLNIASGSHDYVISNVFSFGPDTGIKSTTGEAVKFTIETHLRFNGIQYNAKIRDCFLSRSLTYGIAFLNSSQISNVSIESVTICDVGFTKTTKDTCYPVFFGGSGNNVEVRGLNYYDSVVNGNDISRVIYVTSNMSNLRVSDVSTNLPIEVVAATESSGLQVYNNPCKVSWGPTWSSALDITGTNNKVIHRLSSYQNRDLRIEVVNGRLWIKVNSDIDGPGVIPAADGVYRLGTSSNRWDILFASTGTINTSDERSKQAVERHPDEVLDAWGDVNFCQFAFNDAVAKKGVASARLHSGVIAQQVVKAFSNRGLDAYRYGLLCLDRWPDEYEDVEVVDIPATFDNDGSEITPAQTHIEKKLVVKAGDRYGIRYSEALCMEAAYQRRRADALEQRIAALENAMANTGSISEDNTNTTYLPTKTI